MGYPEFDPGQPRANDGKWSGSGSGDEGSEAWAVRVYESGEVPDGWWVHGRHGSKDLDESWVIQATRDLGVADAYAGDDGSVWIFKPKDEANVLDFSDLDSDAINRAAEKAWEQYQDGSLEEQMARDVENAAYSNGLDKDAFMHHFKEAISPPLIVDNAGAYDDPVWTYWIKENMSPSLVITQDGAVLFEPEDMIRVRVPDDAREDGRWG